MIVLLVLMCAAIVASIAVLILTYVEEDKWKQ